MAKFIEITEGKNTEHEEFPFVSMIGKYILTNVELNDVISYSYVGLGDSLFVAH